MPLVDHEFFATHEFLWDPIIRLDTLRTGAGICRVRSKDGPPDERLTDPLAQRQLFLAMLGAHAAKPGYQWPRFVWVNQETGVDAAMHLRDDVGPVVFLLEDPVSLSDNAELAALLTIGSKVCIPFRAAGYAALSEIPNDILKATAFARLERDILDQGPSAIRAAVADCRRLHYEPIAWGAEDQEDLDLAYRMGVLWAYAPGMYPAVELRTRFSLLRENEGPPPFEEDDDA